MSRNTGPTGPEKRKDLAAGAHKTKSREFYDIIRQIGECKNKTDEDAIMRREQMMLRAILSSPKLDKEKMKEYLIRLLYVEMLGHDASFGYIHAVKATMEGNDLSLKRVAYLATTQFLNEDHDLILLIVNAVQRDLRDDNYLVVCAALTTICRLLNADQIPSVLPQVTELLTHQNEHVRKKAVAALHRFHQRAPSSVEHLHGKFRSMLCDKDPSVMSSALCALFDLITVNPAPHKNLVPSFVSILKQIVEHRLPKQYDYHRVPAPFMQVKLLKILAKLGESDKLASEEMYSVLSVCLKKAADQSGIGNAIVYECVRTAATIYPSPVLLENCAAAVSRFVASGSNNLKYVGLDSLSVITNVNPKFVLEHQMAVVNCLTDSDESLRKKTLDLMFAMCKTHNVEIIVAKMVAFLGDAQDAHTREDVVSKIGVLAERYAPSTSWFIDTMTLVFETGGDVVKPQTVSSLIRLIGEGSGDQKADETLRANAVSAYEALLKKSNRVPAALLRVIVWTLGEFGGLICGGDAHGHHAVMDLLCDASETQVEGSEVLGMVCTACAKLAARGGNGFSTKAHSLVSRNQKSKNVTQTQRARELTALLKEDKAVVTAALPYDSSCVEIDFDANLGFLEHYVNHARDKGAGEYKTEQERALETRRANSSVVSGREIESVSSGSYVAEPYHGSTPRPPPSESLASAQTLPHSEYVPMDTSGAVLPKGAGPRSDAQSSARDPTLHDARGSWGDVWTNSHDISSRPGVYSSSVAPARESGLPGAPFSEPEPPDERSILANALFSCAVSPAPPPHAAPPAPAPAMDLLMVLDSPGAGTPAPDLLGGFASASVGATGHFGAMAGGMMVGLPSAQMGMGPGVGTGVGMGSSGGSFGMAPGAVSSIPAHLRDRTPKKKTDPFADLLG